MKTDYYQSLIPVQPEMAVRIAQKMISEAKKTVPNDRTRGFVVKPKIWEEHASHSPR